MFGFTINGNAVSFSGAMVVALGTVTVLAGFLNLRCAPDLSRMLGILGGLTVGLGTIVSFHSAYSTYAHEEPCLAYAAVGVLVLLAIALGVLTRRAFIKSPRIDEHPGVDDGEDQGHEDTPSQGDGGRGFAGHEENVGHVRHEKDEECDDGHDASYEAPRASPESAVVPRGGHAWTYHGFGVAVVIVRPRRQHRRFIRRA